MTTAVPSLLPTLVSVQKVMPQQGLARAALHELYAAREADAAGAIGVALAFAHIASAGRPMLWVRHGFLDCEAGHPYAPGLAELGLDPGAVTFVRAADAQAVLQAGLEGARCNALGAVVIDLWGEAKALDLTASRRLSMAAKSSGAAVLMVRLAASPQPSAAETRWLVRGAPSRPLPANAPGYPTISMTLLRQRGGLDTGEWHLEWDRDHGCFVDRSAAARSGLRADASLSGAVVPVPVDRPGADGRTAPFRHAG